MHQRSNNLEIKVAPSVEDSQDVVKKKKCPYSGRSYQGLRHRRLSTEFDVRREPGKKAIRFVQRAKKNNFGEGTEAQNKNSGSRLQWTKFPSPRKENSTSLGETLLGAATAQKRVVGWKVVGTKGGKIFTRKDHTSEVLRINSQSGVWKFSN